MDILLLLATLALPLAKLLLFPARTVGRGGGWVVVGAVMIVGMMMALWFAVQSMEGAAPASADKAATRTDLANLPSQADLDRLAKLLQ